MCGFVCVYVCYVCGFEEEKFFFLFFLCVRNLTVKRAWMGGCLGKEKEKAFFKEFYDDDNDKSAQWKDVEEEEDNLTVSNGSSSLKTAYFDDETLESSGVY